eukprot:6739224-Prymnesium_polylepis.1
MQGHTRAHAWEGTTTARPVDASKSAKGKDRGHKQQPRWGARARTSPSTLHATTTRNRHARATPRCRVPQSEFGG